MCVCIRVCIIFFSLSVSVWVEGCLHVYACVRVFGKINLFLLNITYYTFKSHFQYVESCTKIAILLMKTSICVQKCGCVCACVRLYIRRPLRLHLRMKYFHITLCEYFLKVLLNRHPNTLCFPPIKNRAPYLPQEVFTDPLVCKLLLINF